MDTKQLVNNTIEVAKIRAKELAEERKESRETARQLKQLQVDKTIEHLLTVKLANAILNNDDKINIYCDAVPLKFKFWPWLRAFLTKNKEIKQSDLIEDKEANFFYHYNCVNDLYQELRRYGLKPYMKLCAYNYNRVNIYVLTSDCLALGAPK